MVHVKARCPQRAHGMVLNPKYFAWKLPDGRHGTVGVQGTRFELSVATPSAGDGSIGLCDV